MKCVECPFYYKNEDDFFPHCQYTHNDGEAPCEVEDLEEYEEEDFFEDFEEYFLNDDFWEDERNFWKNDEF